MAASRRGKAPSRGKNTPSRATPADQRIKGRGRKPGPKKGSKNKKK